MSKAMADINYSVNQKLAVILTEWFGCHHNMRAVPLGCHKRPAVLKWFGSLNIRQAVFSMVNDCFQIWIKTFGSHNIRQADFSVVNDCFQIWIKTYRSLSLQQCTNNIKFLITHK